MSNIKPIKDNELSWLTYEDILDLVSSLAVDDTEYTKLENIK